VQRMRRCVGGTYVFWIALAAPLNGRKCSFVVPLDVSMHPFLPDVTMWWFVAG